MVKETHKVRSIFIVQVENNTENKVKQSNVWYLNEFHFPLPPQCKVFIIFFSLMLPWTYFPSPGQHTHARKHSGRVENVWGMRKLENTLLKGLVKPV